MGRLTQRWFIRTIGALGKGAQPAVRDTRTVVEFAGRIAPALPLTPQIATKRKLECAWLEEFERRRKRRETMKTPVLLTPTLTLALSASQMAWNNRGVQRREKGDLRGAQRDHEKALEIDPEYALARRNLATLKERMAPAEKAIREAQARAGLARTQIWRWTITDLKTLKETQGTIAVVPPDRFQYLFVEPGELHQVVTIGPDSWMRYSVDRWEPFGQRLSAPLPVTFDDPGRGGLGARQVVTQTVGGHSVIEYEYYSPGYKGECLIKPASCSEEYAGETEFIGAEMSAPERGAYRFTLHPGPRISSPNGRPRTMAFAYTAVPLKPGETAGFAFCVDDTGDICEVASGAAPAVSGGRCRREPPCQPLRQTGPRPTGQPVK